MGTIDIIIFAMIAALILLRLRAELGNRPGSEPRPPRSLHDRPDRPDRPDRLRDDPEEGFGPIINGEAELVDVSGDASVRRRLTEIHQLDPSFDSRTFLAGAKEAYSLILDAFWSGDREALEELVETSTRSRFIAAIEAREQAGEVLDNRLLDINAVRFLDVQLDGAIADITLEFSADLVAVTRDASGAVISGNLSDSVTARDQWCFRRNLRSRDPRWLLMTTRSV